MLGSESGGGALIFATTGAGVDAGAGFDSTTGLLGSGAGVGGVAICRRGSVDAEAIFGALAEAEAGFAAGSALAGFTAGFGVFCATCVGGGVTASFPLCRK